MMKYKGITITIFTISFLLSLVVIVSAIEPKMPVVDSVFDFEKESKINEVAHLSSKEAFERLKGIDFFINEQFLHKAIFKTFEHREAEGIALAMNYLKLPPMEVIGGKLVNRADDLYVAKKVLEVFPDHSVNRLLSLYKRSNAVTKGNIIRASGQIAGGQPIRNLLIKALDDKTFCEEESPEMVGEPLRICDVAYNQLVLRYNIENVLRTIGPDYKIGIRDYHIDILKSKLKF